MNVYEIRDSLWNLIGGDRWDEHEMTYKFVLSLPNDRNGLPRMIQRRITKMGLLRFVKASPQEARDYLKIER